MGINMDSFVFYLVVALAFVVMIILIFLYIKENEINKKFSIHQKAIEELNGHLVSQQTSINTLSKQLLSKSEVIRMLDEEKEDTKEALEAVVEKFKQLSKELEDFKIQNNNNKKTIESQNVPPVVISNNYSHEQKDIDERVVAMHKEGYSNDTISKQLKVSLGEIEFMIKRDNMLNALNINSN